MRLYLVRHAEAAPGEPDELRSLTPEGRRQATRVAERLSESGAQPSAVLCSPLLRARETAELIAEPFGLAPDSDDRLAPGATADGVRAAVAGRGEAVVVVGHQPDCGRIAAELTGGAEPAFPPGGLVELDLS
jgi:phosphohistidine phosphatase SixA